MEYIEGIELFSDGPHKLSGIDSIQIESDYGDITNVILITIDGKTYSCEEDPSDGYRSYTRITLADENLKCMYKFPPQTVYIKYILSTGNYNSWEYRITNEDGNLILRLGTDEYDDYYPKAIFEYYPENLPINKK